MLRRWQSDLKRLEALFDVYDGDDYSNGAEMQRNLGTAIECARGFLSGVPSR